MTNLNCPACGENKLDCYEIRNALSRYRKAYICSDCGMREAFEGDFWGNPGLEEKILEAEKLYDKSKENN